MEVFCNKIWQIRQKRHLSRLMTKPTKWHVHPAKTQIRSDQSDQSLHCRQATHWAHSKDSDKTESSLGAKVILLVLSWGAHLFCKKKVAFVVKYSVKKSKYLVHSLKLSTRVQCWFKKLKFHLWRKMDLVNLISSFEIFFCQQPAKCMLNSLG